MKAWVNDLNTTNFRIVVSILLAVFVTMLLTIGVILVHWEPSAMQLKVLIGIAGGILTMQGFDVLQFVGKRFSDAGYAAAKNQTQPVTTAVTSQENGDNGDNATAPVRLTKTPPPGTDPAIVAALEGAAGTKPGAGRMEGE